jgi:cell division protein FtsA
LLIVAASGDVDEVVLILANERLIVGIDVGTTKVTTLIAEVSRNRTIHVIGVGISPSTGLRKGVVVDIDQTVESIEASVEKAERLSGVRVERAFVGIAGAHVTSIGNRGVVAITRPDREITENDVGRAIDAARVITIPSNREIIHTIPRQFVVDGQDGVRNPIGMLGYRLDVETHIVTGSLTAIQNLTKCVENADIEIEQLVFAPLAAAQAVLTDEEKEMGVALVDIGGGVTQIAVFIEGSVCHVGVIAVGGNHITNDISVRLRAPFAEADELKVRYAHAISSDVDPNDMVEVTSFGRSSLAAVPRVDICEVAEARLQETFLLIQQETQRAGFDGLLPAGLVVVGGTALMSGITELGSEVTRLPVRQGLPRGVYGLVDSISDPSQATAVGLTLWGARNAEGALGTWPVAKRDERSTVDGRHVGGRIFGWLRAILP